MLLRMTRLAPLESSWAKFHRAEKHHSALRRNINRVLDDKRGPFHVERKIQGNQAFLRVTRLPDLRDAGLIFSDAVGNYRAALDHLTWDLVQLGTHPRLTTKGAKQIQFPFAATARDFRKPTHRKLRAPGISDVQWRLMGRYQPYSKDMRGRVMRALRDISDRDKHRKVTPTVSCATGYRGTITTVGCRISGSPRYFPANRALYVGAKIITVDVTPHVAAWDVHIESDVRLRPALTRAIPILWVADHIRVLVREVLTAFEATI